MENREHRNRDPNGYYAILGVTPDATAEELKKAYDNTIDRIYKNGDDRSAIEMVKRIYWLTLEPDHARSEYDCGYKPSSKTTSGYPRSYIRINPGDLPGCGTPPPKSWWGKLFD